MIIDRIAILFIKMFAIKELLSVIKEEDLRLDYLNKDFPRGGGVWG